MFTLPVEKRNTKHKSERGERIRAQGLIPGVFYGPKQKTEAIAVKSADFLKVWKEAGESSVVSLETVDGAVEALIYDVAVNPVNSAPIHIDFYVPEAGKTVTISVPIEFIGVAPAVKDLGGMLVKVLHEIEVEVLPKDLPHSLSVDISALVALDSQIALKDIVLPAGVSFVGEPDTIVAAISVAEEEKADTLAPDLSSIEVEKKGKKEKESEVSSENA